MAEPEGPEWPEEPAQTSSSSSSSASGSNEAEEAQTEASDSLQLIGQKKTGNHDTEHSIRIKQERWCVGFISYVEDVQVVETGLANLLLCKLPFKIQTTEGTDGDWCIRVFI